MSCHICKRECEDNFCEVCKQRMKVMEDDYDFHAKCRFFTYVIGLDMVKSLNCSMYQKLHQEFGKDMQYLEVTLN